MYCPISSCKKVVWKHGLINQIAADHHSKVPDGIEVIEWRIFEQILATVKKDVLTSHRVGKKHELCDEAKDAWLENEDKLRRSLERMGDVVDKDSLLVSVMEFVEESGIAIADFLRTKGSLHRRKGSKHKKGRQSKASDSEAMELEEDQDGKRREGEEEEGEEDEEGSEKEERGSEEEGGDEIEDEEE